MGAWVEMGDKINKRSKQIRLDDEPTPELILKLIENHEQNELPRFQMLQSYYEGYNNILKRTKEDTSKPNNRLVSGFPAYIVDLMQGMMMGKPVKYTSDTEDLMKTLQDIFDYNDEQDENSELSKMAGIKGKSYEVVYLDEDSKVRFNEVDADNVIMVYDTKLTPESKFAIRYYYTTDISMTGLEGTLKAILYTKDHVTEYTKGANGLVETDDHIHTFKQVPVVEYLNNDEMMGDFERVISLIDAYDKTQSDSANDFEEFTDAFLVLAGMMGTDEEAATKLKKDKILLTDGEKQGAYWLIKEINDTATENYKNRLNSDIHRFSKVPEVTDEKFAGNVSGEAMKYKLMAMDQVIASKQRKFKRALQRRIELILNHLTIKDKVFDYRDVAIQFDSNRPVNEKEMVEMAVQMIGRTSLTTALKQMPMIEDVAAELQQMEDEINPYYNKEEIDYDKELEDRE